MEKAIEQLSTKLEWLASQVIAIWATDATYAEGMGWMGPAFNRHDLASFAINLAEDLRDPSLKFNDVQLDLALQFIPRIDVLTNTSVTQMNGGNIGQAIPAYINTLLLFREKLLPRLPLQPLDWEVVEDAKMLPSKIVRRALSANNALSEYEPQISEISAKIDRINEAYTVAEDLPIVLDELRKAKVKVSDVNEELSQFLGNSESAVNEILTKANSSINELLASAKLSEAEIKVLKKTINDSQIEAHKIVENCEEAYRITTTKGLAGAFELKAMELQKSMWYWVFILFVALGVGCWLGIHNLTALSEALGTGVSTGSGSGTLPIEDLKGTMTAANSNNIQWPVIFIRLILSLFSVSAPLWLAWLSTNQISQRFKLAEDYAFKASISKAYEGYRKEAARLDPAFEAQLFGSALTRLDEAPLRLVESHSHNSPFHELVNSDGLQKAFAMFPEAKESFTNALNSIVDLAKSGIKSTANATASVVKPATDSNEGNPS